MNPTTNPSATLVTRFLRGLAALLALSSGLLMPTAFADDDKPVKWEEKLECGSWECVLRRCPDHAEDEDECLGNQGECSVDVQGATFQGTGFAADSSFLCDITVQAATTGLETVTCDYMAIEDPECRGQVKVSCHAEIDGKVKLIDPDCTAAALGYVEIKNNITRDLFVKLEKSQGSTLEEPNPRSIVIPLFGGGSLVITITGGLQAGDRTDHDVDAFDGRKVTNFFTRTIRCRGDIFLWANGGWFGFDTAGTKVKQLKGEGKVEVVLQEVRGCAPAQ